MAIVSYAQNFEDVLLNRVFGGQETGFYVDIGAYDPVIGSISNTLYERGWSGINVEPGSIFEKLAAARPRDVNLQLAVTDYTGEISFLENATDPGMSHIVTGQVDVASPTRTVQCDTLENIVRDHGRGRPTDLIKIDCEGAEFQIVRSTNWRVIRPSLIVIESTLPWSSVLCNQDWEPILIEQGYLRAYFDGINCFYIPDERADLRRHFELPVNVLDGFQRFDPQIAALRIRAEAAEAAMRTQAGAAETRLQELVAELTRSAAQQDLSNANQKQLLEQNTALQRELQVTQNKLEAARRQLDSLVAAQNAAVTAVVEANAYQLADLRSQVAESEARRAHGDRQRDALLGMHGQAAQLRQLIRELQWPDGPAALRAVLPLARLLRRIAGTKAPPVPPEELALLSPHTSDLGVASSVATALVAPPPRRSIAKRAAWLAYRPFRPVGRPPALRFRAFLTMQLHSELQQLDEKISRLREDLTRISTLQPLPAVQIDDPRVAELQTEVRQFGRLLEDTLLTLAMSGIDAKPGD